MVYTPSGGWVEDYNDDVADHSRFHSRTDCPRIRLGCCDMATVPTAPSGAGAARTGPATILERFSTLPGPNLGEHPRP